VLDVFEPKKRAKGSSDRCSRSNDFRFLERRCGGGGCSGAAVRSGTEDLRIFNLGMDVHLNLALHLKNILRVPHQSSKLRR
jgi:hypothetical protein